MRWNLPNLLTSLRILLIPVFVLVYYLPFQGARAACAVLFAVASATDWLDGFLARRLGQTSHFGAFLDPVADKLMVAVTLVLLVQDDPHFVFVLPAMVIVGREIAISALREWMAHIGKRMRVAVTLVAKFKTAVQMAALVLLLYEYPIGSFPTYTVGLLLLYVAAVLTLWSMFVYLRAAWPAIGAER
jgi:CDP-diacylglycerol--glycerol-3-phosphate 3-phosphatidyltransferase/cardiolipin synthase